MPPWGSSWRLATAQDDNRRGKLAIDPQEIGGRVLLNSTARLLNAPDRIRHDAWVRSAQRPIDLDAAVFPTGGVADQAICASEASKPITICSVRRKVLRLVNE